MTEATSRLTMTEAWREAFSLRVPRPRSTKMASEAKIWAARALDWQRSSAGPSPSPATREVNTSIADRSDLPVRGPIGC